MFEEKDSVSRGKELLGSPSTSKFTWFSPPSFFQILTIFGFAVTVLGDSVLAGMDPDMDDAKARAIEQISNIRQKVRFFPLLVLFMSGTNSFDGGSDIVF